MVVLITYKLQLHGYTNTPKHSQLSIMFMSETVYYTKGFEAVHSFFSLNLLCLADGIDKNGGGSCSLNQATP